MSKAQTAETTAYLREVPEAEMHILNAGHFALDEAVDDIAAILRRFLVQLDLGAPKPEKAR